MVKNRVRNKIVKGDISGLNVLVEMKNLKNEVDDMKVLLG